MEAPGCDAAINESTDKSQQQQKTPTTIENHLQKAPMNAHKDTENCEKINVLNKDTKPPDDKLPDDTNQLTSNRNTEPQLTSTDKDPYADHVSYDEHGEAIYTDPETKQKYVWSNEKNEWIAKTDPSSDSQSDPYENEHYRWCTETNQWIPKTSTEKVETETEFYKWNEETKQWVPKTQAANVTCSYEGGLHVYTDTDGMKFFFDTEKNAWFPKIDDDFMARYQMSYGFIDNITKPDEAPNLPSATIEETKNAEPAKDNQAASASLKRKAPQNPPQWFDLPPEQNTKVYVDNLPSDITEEEFIELMSKYGLIMRDLKTQKYRIKLYSEPGGQLKGDGLCTYIKVESVELALKLLDGLDYRGQKLSVQRAKFQMRGEYDPTKKPKVKKKDKEKLQKMKEKLFDWRPEKMRGERSKHERVVILKNMFTPEMFDKKVELIMEYQNTLREECGKYGTVRKVVLYDRHPEGVAQVIMSDPEEADMVVQVLNGRVLGSRKLIAEPWDGKTKYKIFETEAEIQQRLNKWDEFLEKGEEQKNDVLREEKEKDVLREEEEAKVTVTAVES